MTSENQGPFAKASTHRAHAVARLFARVVLLARKGLPTPSKPRQADSQQSADSSDTTGSETHSQGGSTSSDGSPFLKPITAALVTAQDLPYDVVAVGFVLAALQEGCLLTDRSSRLAPAKRMLAMVMSGGEVRGTRALEHLGGAGACRKAWQNKRMAPCTWTLECPLFLGESARSIGGGNS